uniref:Uncharacterized protein n=1 Tax=Heterorhabditis bacteriophora TaxID=37862 RepID=A0A1I7X8S0_HETBA
MTSDKRSLVYPLVKRRKSKTSLKSWFCGIFYT